MKIGDRVTTLHGEGEIVNIEEIFKKNRYGVKLDSSPFSFDIAGYWSDEIAPLKLTPQGWGQP